MMYTHCWEVGLPLFDVVRNFQVNDQDCKKHCYFSFVLNNSLFVTGFEFL
jgi:hypothetical protein